MRPVEEAPSKEAWREEPEPLLKLATGKRKRMALRKDNCLRSQSGTGKERNHLEGPRDRTAGCGESTAWTRDAPGVSDISKRLWAPCRLEPGMEDKCMYCSQIITTQTDGCPISP